MTTVSEAAAPAHGTHRRQPDGGLLCRAGLPARETLYPLVKKRQSADDRLLHGGDYERYNACVGGKLQIKYLSPEAHDAHQHVLAGMAAVVATSSTGGPLSL